MKTFLLILAFVGVALGTLYAATTQPRALGLVTLAIEVKTLAQANAYTPSKAGQLIFCSDCVQSLICVSSGTATGAWVVVASSHSAGTLASMAHCR